MAIPQLLSLLVERQPPFFYGNEGSALDGGNRSNSTRLSNQESTNANDDSLPLTSSGGITSALPNEGNTSKLDLYGNFPCIHHFKVHHNIDTADENDKPNIDLLEMLRWSIQPPHPVTFEEHLSESTPSNIFSRK